MDQSDYINKYVISPLTIENKTYVDLSQVITDFNSTFNIQESKRPAKNIFTEIGALPDNIYLVAPSQIPKTKFHQALYTALNLLTITETSAMSRNPQNDRAYNRHSLVLWGLRGKAAEEYINEDVHPYIEQMHIGDIINDLDFKLPPKFVKKYLQDNRHNFSEFKKDLLKEKKSNGWNTSLWVTTDFMRQEITDYFKVANDLGFFDKIIVLDNKKYAFVLDPQIVDNQDSLYYVSNDLVYILRHQ